MADRELKVKISIDTGGLASNADAAAKAFEGIGKAAEAAGRRAESSSQSAGAAVAAAAEKQASAAESASKRQATAAESAARATEQAVLKQTSAQESASERTAGIEARTKAAREWRLSSGYSELEVDHRAADASQTAAKAAEDRAVAEVDAAQQRMDAANQAADESEKADSKISEGAKKAGLAIGAAIAAGAVVAGKAIIDLGMQYEQSLNVLQAVSGASADKMKQVSAAAMQLGNDIKIPGASASDAAEAMTELAKGGLSVDAAMQAARGTLQLATAAQVSGAEAAQIQANALNAFGLQAEQAGHVADVLANTANAASGEITDLAAALQQSAGIASSFGISIDDTATALGLFAKNGMIGSDAGTSLKTALTALASPTNAQATALETLGVTAYDAQGQFVGLKVLTGELEGASKTLTQQQFNQATSTAFGTDAMRAAVYLAKEGAAGWDQMSTAVGKAGGAADLAAAQTQGVTGALNNVKNNLETVGLTIYQQYAPAVADMLNQTAQSLPAVGAMFADVLGAVMGFVSGIASLPGPVLAGAAALGAVILLKGPFITAGLAMRAAFVGFGEQMAVQSALAGASITRLQAGMAVATMQARALGASLLSVVGGIPGLVLIAGAALISMAGSIGDIEVKTHDFSSALDELSGKLDAVKAGDVVSDGTLSRMQDAGVAVGDYTLALSGNVDAQNRVTAALLANKEAAGSNIDAWTNAGVLLGQYGGDLARASAAEQDHAAKVAETTRTYFDVGAAIAPLPDALDGVAGGVQGVGDAAGAAGTPMDRMAEAIKAVKDEATNADTKIQFLQMTLDKLNGKATEVEAASRVAQAAIRGYAETYQGQAAATDAVDAANRKVTESQISLTEAQDKGTSSSYSQQQKDLDVAAAADALRDAQRGVLTATNDVTDASDSLFNKGQDVYRGMLQQSQSAYDNAAAHGNLQGAYAASVAAGGAVRTSFIDQMVAAGMSRDAASKYADQLGLIPTQVSTQVVLNGADAANVSLSNLQQRLDALNGKVSTATVHVLQSGVNAVASVASLFRADGGFVEARANGGITPAAGGMIRQPMIAKGGANILWAEPETGWEAYISGKPSELARNQGVLAEAASRIGMTASVDTSTRNVYGGGGSGASAASAPIIVNKTFPITWVDQGQKLTVESLQRVMREAERTYANA